MNRTSPGPWVAPESEVEPRGHLPMRIKGVCRSCGATTGKKARRGAVKLQWVHACPTKRKLPGIRLVPPFHRQSPRLGTGSAMARTESLPDIPVLEERVPKVPSGSSRLAKTERPHGMENPWPGTSDPTLNYLSLFVVTRAMRCRCMKRLAHWLCTRMGSHHSGCNRGAGTRAGFS